MRGLLLILSSLAANAFAADEIATDVEVDTPRGRLRGKHVDFGNNQSDFQWGQADVFLGIPFVLPPVNERRFQRPTPTCQYTSDGSTYVVQKYGNACPQSSHCSASQDQAEDCLTLNVFTPDVNSQYKYPVMVYIHGGGLMGGCAGAYPYQGAVTNMVNRGVVVVTIQYRINVLGFFTTMTEDFPANLGMLDQVEALKWVKDQISYFGGDPYRVTIFGQSAGGASVSAHTYSPLSQDLFQQAIMQSGVALTCIEGSLGYDQLSKRRAKELCNVSPEDFDNGKFDKLKTCMMAADPADMVKYDEVNIIGWKMQYGDDFMPDIPNHLNKFRHNIPVLIGSMHDEWAYYDMQMMKIGVTTFNNYSRSFFEFEYDVLGYFLSDVKVNMMNILENVYAGVGAPDDDHELWLRAGCAALTSAGFTGFIIRDFKDYLDNGNKNMWLYEMTYPKAIGRVYDLPGFPEAVFHSAEGAYLWKRKNAFDDAEKSGYANEDDYALADWFGRTWTNFAKYGKPTTDDSWPNLRSGTETYLDITGPNPVVNYDGYKIRDNVVWNQVLVALHGDFYPSQFNSTGPSLEDFNKIKSRVVSTSDFCDGYTGTMPPQPNDPETSTSTPSTSTSISSSTVSPTTTTSSVNRISFICALFVTIAIL